MKITLGDRDADADADAERTSSLLASLFIFIQVSYSYAARHSSTESNVLPSRRSKYEDEAEAISLFEYTNLPNILAGYCAYLRVIGMFWTVKAVIRSNVRKERRKRIPVRVLLQMFMLLPRCSISDVRSMQSKNQPQSPMHLNKFRFNN